MNPSPKPRGRPRLPDDKRLTTTLGVRLTTDEAAAIREVAATKQVTAASLIRAIVQRILGNGK